MGGGGVGNGLQSLSARGRAPRTRLWPAAAPMHTASKAPPGCQPPAKHVTFIILPLTPDTTLLTIPFLPVDLSFQVFLPFTFTEEG